MTRKQKRTLLLSTGLAMLAVATGLVLYALNDTIMYFYTPAKVVEMKVPSGQPFRLGGLVEKGTVEKGNGLEVRFKITDTKDSLPVYYKGQLPDLFGEGEGVVATGRLDPEGVFVADTILAKHDEKYMPREVADELKKQGLWQESK
ncbi:MAG: cytochrome c maturation protein CcmE [Hyphomicrobiales bacterium]